MTQLRLWSALAGLAAAAPLWALNPSLSIGQYLHTSWTQEEGSALPPVQALAQATDGYLWLGTSQGLIRFDGMRFVEWSAASGPALPSRDIRCLRRAAGGGLWVGTAAGVCRVDHGRIVRYPAADKLPCGVIASMLEDRLARLWMINACPKARTLALLSPDGSLRTFGTGDGLPEQTPNALFQDSQANLWIGTESALCQWWPGAQAACSSGRAFDVLSIAEAANGQLAIADGGGKQLFRFSKGQAEALGPRVPDSSFTPGVMICDRDGNVWIGTQGQGLLRVRGNKLERFTRSDGLSSNFVTSLVEDQEGDVWVATARGVDRMRDPKVQIFSTLDGLSGDLINAVYGAQDGATWIGTASGLNRLDGDRVTRYSAADGLPSAVVVSLYEDVPHQLWAGTAAGLAVQSGNRFVQVLTAGGQRLDRVFNIGGNHSGTVWLADSRLGLFTIRGGSRPGVAQPVGVPNLASSDIYGLLVTRDGAVWLGHHSGGVTVVCDGLGNGPPKHYDARDGLGKGPVRALYQDREGAVWIGTGDGLSRFRDARWTTWTTAQGLPEGGVRGIAGDETGGLWLLTAPGVLRLSRDSLDGPPKALPYVLYGRTEGLRLFNNGGMTNPRLAEARSGNLLAGTEDGLAVIDPARVKSNQVPPPVAIEQLIVDGKPIDFTLRGEAAFRGRNLQIGYTGISLMVPERVRFRYRMRNLDSGWTEAGTRRNVTYMNVPPGHYRFQAIASNNDGVWNDTGAEIALRVDPYFYETRWFALVCLTAVALAAWFVHHLRMRSVLSRLQLIVGERTRISRELHDSLLQGFAGVVYLLEAAVRQFEAVPEISKESLERALEQTDRSLREARQMIVSMRIPALENSTLPQALGATLAQMADGVPVDFQMEVKGRVRQGLYDVEANVFLIAREAVANGLKHASATRIRAELRYMQKQLLLTVEDNGTGFDPEVAYGATGHWGVRGMRERARQIGATFCVESTRGRGTRIEVSAPWKN